MNRLHTLNDYLKANVSDIDETLVITTDHSVDDVIKWLLEQETASVLVLQILENSKTLPVEDKKELLLNIHNQLMEIACKG